MSKALTQLGLGDSDGPRAPTEPRYSLLDITISQNNTGLLLLRQEEWDKKEHFKFCLSMDKKQGPCAAYKIPNIPSPGDRSDCHFSVGAAQASHSQSALLLAQISARIPQRIICIPTVSISLNPFFLKLFPNHLNTSPNPAGLSEHSHGTPSHNYCRLYE